MQVLEQRPRTITSVLRGDPQRRPLPDRQVAAGLRAQLEDGIFSLWPNEPREPVTVRASAFTLNPTSTEGTSTGQFRGLLLNQLLRLLAMGVTISDPFANAIEAWRSEDAASPLLTQVDQLDAEDLARLRADVQSHFTTLERNLGPLPASWEPRSAVRAYQRLAGGQVILRDAIDLSLGTTTSERASVVLVDVTTSPLGASAERIMRYHALVQTLRTGVAPLRSAAFSSATAELWVLDVTNELLQRGVDDVLHVLSKVATA